MKQGARRRPWMRGWSAWAVVATLGLAISACTSGSPTTSQETIYIGVGGPMTGDAAVNGKQIMEGAQLAIDLINNSGGIAGGPKKGAKLALKQFDDKDDPQTGQTVARQVISDTSLAAYAGSALSDLSVGQASLFERAQMPFLNVYASANSILEPAKQYVFVVPPTFDAYSYSIVNFMNKQGVKSVGILHLTGTYGTLIADYAVQRSRDLGIQVVDSEPFNFGDTDFRTQLGKIKAGNPQALIMVGLVDSDSLMLKQAKQIGLNVPAYDAGGITFNQDFLKAAGANAEGVTGNTPSDPQRNTPAAKKLISEWKTKYGTDVIADASAFAYESITVIAKAFEAGATGRADLATYLHKVNIADTGIAPLSFASNGARQGGRLWIFQIKGNNFVFQTGYVQNGTFNIQETPLER
jgi:branched-chain amino acid transport system substrate-binding protein